MIYTTQELENMLSEHDQTDLEVELVKGLLIERTWRKHGLDAACRKQEQLGLR